MTGFQAMPVKGDCVSTPVTEVTLTGQGHLRG